MKRLPFLMAMLAVLAAGCSKDNPTTPAVDDTHIQYKATLLPANEVPAIQRLIASVTDSWAVTGK